MLSKRVLWLALPLLFATAFLCFAYPMYVIRPFRVQGASELAAALVVKRIGPIVATIAALLSVAATVQLWRKSRWMGRTGSILVTLLTLPFAYLAQFNVYEMMFHPVPKIAFTPADSAKVDADDMVLTVTMNGRSHAYPIRTMGYHHIANDFVGGVAIVATY